MAVLHPDATEWSVAVAHPEATESGEAEPDPDARPFMGPADGSVVAWSAGPPAPSVSAGSPADAA